MRDTGGCTKTLGIEPVLTATDAAVVVDVRAVDTAVTGAIVVAGTDVAVAIDAGALRGIAPSTVDTELLGCVA